MVDKVVWSPDIMQRMKEMKVEQDKAKDEMERLRSKLSDAKRKLEAHQQQMSSLEKKLVSLVRFSELFIILPY